MILTIFHTLLNKDYYYYDLSYALHMWPLLRRRHYVAGKTTVAFDIEFVK